MTKTSSENADTTHDLPPEVFVENARRAIDWIARYLQHMSDYPVLAKTRPGEIKRELPISPPDNAEPFEKIFTDFEDIIVPGITHWNHPRFFAYFSVTGSYPGIIGELLSSALNVNAMLWKTSPAATELEEVVLDWLRQMLGLPETFEGVINDTASSSSLYAMAAAREYAGLDIRTKGIAGRKELPPLYVYASEEAHSSIEKAAIVLGFGQEHFRKIGTDAVLAMSAEALEGAISRDLRNGGKPVCVIATIGTTSTTSVDPVADISKICEKYDIWLHVDAAYGGAAALLPEKRALFEDWHKADSIVVNPHKWLATPIDCSVAYCRKPEILKAAFSLTPEYLRTSEAGEVKNLMDYGVSLGRRFRALKLWMIIRALGVTGLQRTLRDHLAWAQRLAEQISAHPDFILKTPVLFSTLVFQYAPERLEGDEAELEALNAHLLEEINRSGQVYLSHTKVKGSYCLRLTIGNFKTSWDDVALAWRIIRESAQQVAG